MLTQRGNWTKYSALISTELETVGSAEKIRMVGVKTETRTQDLPNVKQKLKGDFRFSTWCSRRPQLLSRFMDE